jgi:hypothetical protein
MNALRKYLAERQMDALQLQSILTAANACVGDERRAVLATNLVEEALTIATELYRALDSQSLPEF